MIGSMFSLLDGTYSKIIFVVPVAIVAGFIMATLIIRIRTTDPENISKLFKLYFMLCFCSTITIFITGTISDSSSLTTSKAVLFLGLSFLLGFLLAKVSLSSRMFNIINQTK